VEQEFGAAAAAATEKAKPTTVKRTGKTETIAGYKCEHIMVTEGDGTSSDVCAAGRRSSRDGRPRCSRHRKDSRSWTWAA
jgi:hypothetical protein